MPRIMIVEDESDVREFLSRALHRLLPAAEIDTAENGSEALQLFQQRRYDLILTDQRMPIMRGTDLLMAVRAEGSDVPVVFITADMIAEEQALQAGASAVFIKPVSLRQLRKILETWLHTT
jgi:CheY-like chemotaxis protein